MKVKGQKVKAQNVHTAWVSVDIANVPKEVQEDRKFHMQNFANIIASFALKTKRGKPGEKIPPRLLELGRVMCKGEWYIFVAEMWANEVPGGNVQVKRLVKNPPDEGEDAPIDDDIDDILGIDDLVKDMRNELGLS